jgi:RNA polymerase sigma-70 factor (ECF subfamily)
MSDPETVERAMAGDLAAYGRLVSATEAMVRGVVGREIRDPGLAEDAVQETYLRAFRKLAGLSDPAAFPGWLKRVAVNVARNERRRRRLTFVDPDRLPDRREPANDDDPIRAALAAALVRLDPAERRLLERHYRGGWSTARLADAENVSESALRKRLQRARDRLRKDIAMSMQTKGTGDLPERIVELLSRPVLLDLPENPVGAVWEEIRATRPDDVEIELPERIALAEIESLFGPDAVPKLPPILHRVSDAEILRFDLTIPLLLAARGRPDGARLLTAGKVYRDEPADCRRLQSFHQAELFWSGPGLRAWDLMGWFADALDRVLPGRPLRVLEVEYPIYAGCRRGYEVHVRNDEEWLEIAGFARCDNAVVAKLGLDPDRTNVVSLGMGLERIACLRYDIEDVRQVETRRVDD